MNKTANRLNIPATPLNNVHFGLVSFCPLIGKSLAGFLVRLEGGAFISKHGGKDMERNNGQEICWKQFAKDVTRSEWKQKSIQEDARKFEKIIQSTRLRLGLEVARA